MHLKISSAKWRPFCSGGHELTHKLSAVFEKHRWRHRFHKGVIESQRGLTLKMTISQSTLYLYCSGTWKQHKSQCFRVSFDSMKDKICTSLKRPFLYRRPVSLCTFDFQTRWYWDTCQTIITSSNTDLYPVCCAITKIATAKVKLSPHQTIPCHVQLKKKAHSNKSYVCTFFKSIIIGSGTAVKPLTETMLI